MSLVIFNCYNTIVDSKTCIPNNNEHAVLECKRNKRIRFDRVFVIVWSDIHTYYLI